MIKKSQMSFEFIVILVFVVGVSLFFLLSGLNTTEPFIKDKIYGAGEKLVTEIDTVLKLGPNNKRKIYIDFPPEVNSYSYANGEIIVTANLENGAENFYFSVPRKVVGKINGELIVEYVINSTSNYICVYEQGDRHSCCYDFACDLG